MLRRKSWPQIRPELRKIKNPNPARTEEDQKSGRVTCGSSLETELASGVKGRIAGELILR